MDCTPAMVSSSAFIHFILSLGDMSKERGIGNNFVLAIPAGYQIIMLVMLVLHSLVSAL